MMSRLEAGRKAARARTCSSRTGHVLLEDYVKPGYMVG